MIEQNPDKLVSIRVMLRRKKSYITPLAFMMLILFVSPMTVKAIHHHVSGQMPAPESPKGKSVTSIAVSCPVCQFEFVTFMDFANQDYSYYRLLSPPDACEPANGVKGNSFTCYSLRAPPAS